MVSRVSLSGLALIAIGLLIAIVHALNMSRLFSVENMLPELSIVLVGLAVQLLGLGLLLIDKK